MSGKTLHFIINWSNYYLIKKNLSKYWRFVFLFYCFKGVWKWDFTISSFLKGTGSAFFSPPAKCFEFVEIGQNSYLCNRINLYGDIFLSLFITHEIEQSMSETVLIWGIVCVQHFNVLVNYLREKKGRRNEPKRMPISSLPWVHSNQ